jgi:hypothetical protein
MLLGLLHVFASPRSVRDRPPLSDSGGVIAHPAMLGMQHANSNPHSQQQLPCCLGEIFDFKVLFRFESQLVSTIPAVQPPETIGAQDAPVGADGFATHATLGEPLKPLLHTPTQLLPAARLAQLLGKDPLGRGAGGVPVQVGVTVRQAAMAAVAATCPSGHLTRSVQTFWLGLQSVSPSPKPPHTVRHALLTLCKARGVEGGGWVVCVETVSPDCHSQSQSPTLANFACSTFKTAISRPRMNVCGLTWGACAIDCCCPGSTWGCIGVSQTCNSRAAAEACAAGGRTAAAYCSVGTCAGECPVGD